MSTPRAVLRRKDTTSASAMHMSFDLGDKKWQICVGDGRCRISRFTVAAGDKIAVADRVNRAAKHFKIDTKTRDASRSGLCTSASCEFRSHRQRSDTVLVIRDSRRSIPPRPASSRR